MELKHWFPKGILEIGAFLFPSGCPESRGKARAKEKLAFVLPSENGIFNPYFEGFRASKTVNRTNVYVSLDR